ncbi:junctional adhesion molecule A-like [Notolabrus celidotus]|uniref:junctional adhesion molecule A-like n=1 Tax=Notolabrus celidotus TaxID=1203425 RepID=UPI00148F6F91|nr:junctional adhesion molecule A-like [Notolabrus celidotus]
MGSRAFMVQGQNGFGVTYSHLQICASKGSTVKINCTFTYPGRIAGGEEELSKTFWFANRETLSQDIETSSQYSGRVKNTCEENRCTLRITDLRESDADQYMFRIITKSNKYFGRPGVKLYIPDLEVVIGTKNSGLQLKCLSSSPADTAFIWFKNGTRIKQENSQYHSPGLVLHADRYSCAVRGYEKCPSPSVYAPNPPSVSGSPSAEVKVGSSVTLNCSSDANPAANYTWYKKNGTPDLHLSSSEAQLVFSAIQSSDSGQYYCEAENSLGKATSESISIDVKWDGVLLVVAGSVAVVLLLILSLFVFLWIRKKKRAVSESSVAEERPNDTEQLDQAQPEEQNELQYASIHFSRNQTNLYSNITPARLIRHMEEQDFSEYAAVRCASTSTANRTRGQEAEEDPATVYSTVKAK